MRHPSEGALRAYSDGTLGAPEREQLRRHLASCARCADRASTLDARTRRVHALLAELEPETSRDAVTPRLARQRFEAYRRERKERPVSGNLFARRYRPAWAVGLLVIVVAVTLTVPPVRSLAGELLGLFRVQTIEFTPVSEEAWPDEATMKAVAPEIERVFDEALTVTTAGEGHTLTEAEARGRAEFRVRLPDAGGEATRYEWTPPVHIAYHIDLPRISALFAELGYSDIDLPTSLYGKTVEADLAVVLTASYGDCPENAPAGDECTVLVQMPSPTASVPDGLDIDQLGRIYLELLGMPVEQASRLSERVDWTTTLVLPFPHHVNLTHEMVHVDGVEGTLIHSESPYRPAPEYLLTWIKHGVIYAFSGKGDYHQALDMASALR